MKFKKYDKEDRGKLVYTLSHWLAFNYVAIRQGCWRPRFLLHDAEKPFLMLWYRGDYSKVQRHHRTHSRHHLEYSGKHSMDWLGMIIDWECAHLTKKAKPLVAIEKIRDLVSKDRLDEKQVLYLADALTRAHLAYIGMDSNYEGGPKMYFSLNNIPPRYKG